MTKRFRSILSILLTLVLLAGMLPMTAAAAGTPFTDVDTNDWFSAPVLWAVDNNITGGIGNGKFGPNNPCTRAQVVTFLWAAEGKPEPKTTINPFTDVANNAWYLKPVLWAVERGITGGTSNTTFSPNSECTRAQIVTFLYAAAGKPSVNAAASGFLDVMRSDWFFNPVMWAKENDITGGTGPNTFGPLNVCTRGQVVTFLYKAYNGSTKPDVTPTPTAKPTFTPTPTPTVQPVVTPAPTPEAAMNAQEIYAKCASAVFYIEIYNRSGQAVSSGSGVFLNADGLAITNHHVVEDAHSAKIMTTDGTVYNVSGYYDAQESIDMALIQVDGSGFNYLPVGDYASIAGGQNIFAIGSPKGFDNSISAGIISNPKRVLNGIDFIQMTAPISPGSSGGALINDKGQLIGINTAYYEGGQNLNLAVPIYHKDELTTGTLKSFPLGSSAPTDYGASLTFDAILPVQHTITEALHITATEGNYPYPNEVSVYFEIEDESIATGEWSDWNGDNVDLYVYGVKPGTTTATIYLLGKDDYVLASGTVTIVVSEVSYGASMNLPSDISIEKDSTSSVSIFCNRGSYQGSMTLTYGDYSKSIISIAKQHWNGDEANLDIKGLAVGTTTIYFSLETSSGQVMTEGRLTVTVTEAAPQVSRAQQAYAAMKDWIIANNDSILNGTYIYTEKEEYDDSMIAYCLMYKPDTDYIAVAVFEEYNVSGIMAYVEAYVDLDPNYDKGYSELYFYAYEPTEDNLLFEGYAEFDRTALDSDYVINFTEYNGDSEILSDCGKILSMECLQALRFADKIFENYLPAYSVADFGYTNIYN